MTDPVEREIKLPFDSPDAARAAVATLGATPLRARRLQDDRLLDSPDGQLRHEHCTLRVRLERRESGAAMATVTFKGPPRPDVMKVREELETDVGDGALLLRVFERIGWRIWFRYQKYREEFERDGVIVALDETPVGAFVELEGDEAGIARLARALGRTADDYVVSSYRRLFVQHCEARGVPATDMLFDESARR